MRPLQAHARRGEPPPCRKRRQELPRPGPPLRVPHSGGKAGLLRAVDRGDPDRGHRLSTYGTWWIRQGVQRGIRDRGRAIRFPAHTGDRVAEAHAVRRAMTAELGRKPTPKSWSEGSVGRPIRSSTPSRYQQSPPASNAPWVRPPRRVPSSAPCSPTTHLTPPPADRAVEAMGQQQVRKTLKKALAGLKPAERTTVVRPTGSTGTGHANSTRPPRSWAWAVSWCASSNATPKRSRQGCSKPDGTTPDGCYRLLARIARQAPGTPTVNSTPSGGRSERCGACGRGRLHPPDSSTTDARGEFATVNAVLTEAGTGPTASAPCPRATPAQAAPHSLKGLSATRPRPGRAAGPNAMPSRQAPLALSR